AKKIQPWLKSCGKALLTAEKTEFGRYAGFKQAVFLVSCNGCFLVATFYKGHFFFLCVLLP
ncbi:MULTISPECIES: hypothetical protein, partial [Candidatus Cardinium]|uniref:hypothetical protein n=1 Tax=Candidatus Cardinium TaxID=273135 RepID=UPI001FA99FBB